MIEKCVEIQLALVKEAEKLRFKRYLFNKINFSDRLIGVIGARGTGKTTLLLHYYLHKFKDPGECLYFSADNINVVDKGLYNLAEEYFNLGGKVLLIDEVHKYRDWQIELKNIYDSFPNKKVIFSGSSSIDILKSKADLSRRAVYYNLKGLSFREYLQMRLDREYNVIGFSDLLENHVKHSEKIQKDIPVLKYFKEYLRHGYYPFFVEGPETFILKLSNVVEKIFTEDIPSLFNIKYTTIQSLKKLFYLTATSQPFTPNILRISSDLGISKEYVYAYIEELEKAGMFVLLYPKAEGFRLVRKPQKIYLENTNLFSIVEEEKSFPVQIGSIRETFFANQVMNVNHLFYSDRNDFTDKSGRVYEIGGKSKEMSYKDDIIYAVDDINVGFKNKIPLWLFGFLY